MRLMRVARSGSAAVRPDVGAHERVSACRAAGDRVTAVNPFRTYASAAVRSASVSVRPLPGEFDRCLRLRRTNPQLSAPPPAVARPAALFRHRSTAPVHRVLPDMRLFPLRLAAPSSRKARRLPIAQETTGRCALAVPLLLTPVPVPLTCGCRAAAEPVRPPHACGAGNERGVRTHPITGVSRNGVIGGLRMGPSVPPLRSQASFRFAFGCVAPARSSLAGPRPA